MSANSTNYSCTACHKPLVLDPETTTIVGYAGLPGFWYVRIICLCRHQFFMLPPMQHIDEAEALGCPVSVREGYPAPYVLSQYDEEAGRPFKPLWADMPLSKHDESEIAFLGYLLNSLDSQPNELFGDQPEAA